MKQRVLTMLALQEAMNSKVHSDWAERDFEWYRAIWVECAELLDHYGWKWWKHQQPDVDQVKLELIDIWHFGLSILLLSGNSTDVIAEQVEAQLTGDISGGDFCSDVEDFACHTLQRKSFDVAGFGRLMKGMDLSFDELFSRYVGKNVLNFFRQDNGYKDGSYRKLWQGREDNEHLIEAIAELDADSETFEDDLYRALTARYNGELAS